MTGPDRRLRRRIYNTLAGLASVIVAVIYVASLGIKRIPTDDPDLYRQLTNTPDKVATQVEIYRFDENGNLNHRLNADRAEYFLSQRQAGLNDQSPENTPAIPVERVPMDFETDAAEFGLNVDENLSASANREFILLANPGIEFFRENQGSIHGQSLRGYLLPSSNTVEMTGDVMINDSKSESFLYSDTLTINTLQKQAYTHDPVKLLSPNATTTAKGLQGNLIQERWQFLGEVRSTINPQ